MRNNLINECIIIGLITIIVGFVTTRILSFNKHPQFNDPNFGIMIFNYFIIGFILHLLFEIFGINEYFCKYQFS